MRPVDLRSDTVTRPTLAMRRAIFEAEVGDDVFGDDPTVNRLEAMTAERLGKEAAIFVPSGTMANQLAIRLHTRPGDEILMESGAHPFNFEAGAAAILSGASIRPMPGDRGQLDPAQIRAALRPVDPHFSPITLVCTEDTANRGGGSVHPLPVLDALAEAAESIGAAAHLDGARLWNAAIASGIDVGRRARRYDTVSVCLSKGLGAPAGSLLCGPRALITHTARRFRKAFGGGMRQSGILAAAGVYALDHHVDRLAEDHERARSLAEGLRSMGLSAPVPETNMVFVTFPGARGLMPRLESAGLRCGAVAADTLRLVTHLDVSDEGLSLALSAFRSTIGA